VVCFTLAKDVTKYDVYDVSHKLRERGWLVPPARCRRSGRTSGRALPAGPPHRDHVARRPRSPMPHEEQPSS
jgi:hypothetical protein